MIKLKENIKICNLVLKEKIEDYFSDNLAFAISWILHELFEEAEAMSFNEEQLNNSFMKTREDFFKEFDKRLDDFFYYDIEEYKEANQEYSNNLIEVLNKIEELFFNNDLQGPNN